MVFYFSTNAHKEGENAWLIYMGKDKYENEDLIKHGWPVDVWFHVDNLSSAHVYLRLPDGGTLDDIPANVLEECCQIVKHNSIQGCKSSSVDVVYTLWGNLKKAQSMEVGQVGFHKQSEVRKVKNVEKKSDMLKKINKTQVEAHPDLEEQRKEYDRRIAKESKRLAQIKRAEEKELIEKKRKEAEDKSYVTMMDEEQMQTNKEVAGKYESVEDMEDDFM